MLNRSPRVARLETAGMAVYMEEPRRRRARMVASHRMTSERQDVVQPVFALRAGV